MEMNKDWSFFLKIVMTVSLALATGGEGTRAQEELDVLGRWHQYSDASNALYHHLTDQAYELLKQRADRIASIESPDQWQQQQEMIRETLMDIVGPFPEKTPLNAMVTRTIEKEGYRLEHIIYESQPAFYVTSTMYIPEGLRGKAPAVIYCSGHSAPGYRNPVYQHVIINLVKKGFIVFAFDPVGQGERIQYFDPETGESKVGVPTKEHSYPGAQAFITGSSQARYMIWDGIRAVDYLLSRGEVDPSRIGITGRSGGGTQSSYIAAFDERIKATAPECFMTNLTRLFQSIGPQDAEQNLFYGIRSGIDHPDLLLARAPKPALMITTTRDFFSIQGARETAQEVAEIYRICGKAGNFSMVEDDFKHGSTELNREAMYAFFQKHLDNPGDPADREVESPSDEDLQVTPTGQVATSFEGETVFSLNRLEAEKLITKLESARKASGDHLKEALQSAKDLSGFIEPTGINEPVFTGGIQKETYRIEKYFVQGEGDYVIPYLLMIPEKPGNKALIYLHPSGKAAGAIVGGEAEWFVRQGITVLLPDMIGVGELGKTNAQGDAIIDGVSHNVWYASMLIGRSITGIRAGDVIRIAQLLEEKYGLNDISGLARGNMGPVLLHAAAFDQSIRRIALIEPLSSYRALVMSRYYHSGFLHNTVGGALQSYDLPDIAACLAPRKLMMMGITDALGDMVDPGQIAVDLDVIRNTYHNMDADGQLIIVPQNTSRDKYDIYSDWNK